jgi:uncharacterized ion transporter superfamily protein YfcC
MGYKKLTELGNTNLGKPKKFTIGKDILFTFLYMLFLNWILPVFGFKQEQIGIVFIVMAIYIAILTYLNRQEEIEGKKSWKTQRISKK